MKKHIFDSFLLDYSVEEGKNVFKICFRLYRHFSTRTFMYEQISKDYARHKVSCFNFDEECLKAHRKIFSLFLSALYGVYRGEMSLRECCDNRSELFAKGFWILKTFFVCFFSLFRVQDPQICVKIERYFWLFNSNTKKLFIFAYGIREYHSGEEGKTSGGVSRS